MITIPGYRDLVCIYESESSQIFRARREQDNLPVILKLLREDYPSSHELIRYRQEYKITSLLSGRPGIIQTLGTGEYGTTSFIVLEDFGAESLKDMLEQRKFTLLEKISLAVRMARSIGEVHAAHIIHKDINLSNFVYNPETDTLKLIDFGISTQLLHECPEIRSPTVLEGTLAYISPEQTGRMNRTIDYRTDFYSLGAALYQLFTGWLPFEIDDPMELVHCHLARSPALPHQLSPAIPEMVSAILMKLMAKMPEDRYQSAAGIQTDLQKCTLQLQKMGRVQSFALGLLDVPEQLLIPQKLYGRDAELLRLLKAFDRVAAGGKELMLVSGHSGIGKTALVQELFKPMTECKGYFISGKFDQLKRDLAYSALSEAFNQLIRQLLTLPEAQLEQWRRLLQKTLGPNGKVVAEVVPDLELVVGPQPVVEEVSPQECQNRFNYVFQNFIQAIAQPEHPLILFVDDLQWADSASLTLLKLIMTTPEIKYLHLIAAFRDNEVCPSHPWMLAVKELEVGGCPIESVSLGPLDVTFVNELLSDALRSEPDETQELAELVHGKTQGNPFFVAAFLRTLDRNGFLSLDRETGSWQWNLRQIRALGITDNVAELMVQSLRSISPRSQQVLSLAACIGNRFELPTLAVVCESNLKQTLSLLQPAMAEGFVLPLGQEYKAIEHDVLVSKSAAPIGFKFVHDRIQQAAYSLIPASQRNTVHWKIGKLLQAASGDPIEIANHLNFCAEQLTGAAEKEALAQLNLQSGLKAKASAAYKQAFRFLNVGLDLLGSNGWTASPALTLALHQAAAETACLCADFESMQKLAEQILAHSNSILARVKAQEIMVTGCAAQNDFSGATSSALTGLRQLGLSFPEHPSRVRVLLCFLRTRFLLKRRGIDHLSELPEMVDPLKQAAFTLIGQVGSTVYYSAPLLFALMSFERVRMLLAHGNNPWSGPSLSTYAIIECGRAGDLEAGYRIGKAAILAAGRAGQKRPLARTLVMFYTFIGHWKEHLSTCLEPLLSAYEMAQDCGDHEFAANACTLRCQYRLCVGLPLDEVSQQMTDYGIQLRQFGQETMRGYLEIYHFFVRSLLTSDRNYYLLHRGLPGEEALMDRSVKARDRSAIFCVQYVKLMLGYMFRDHAKTLAFADQAWEHYDSMIGTFHTSRFVYYDSLARLAACTASSWSARRRLLGQVKRNQRRMKAWAEHAPMNHLHAYQLVEAERWRILGEPKKAIKHYRISVDLAHEHGWVHEEGLANELAGRMYQERNEEEKAAFHLLAARHCYLKWGARAKVDQLDQEFRTILPKQLEKTATRKTITVTLGGRTTGVTRTTTSTRTSTAITSLDLGSAIKASQTISGEIELSRLLETLMKIIQENAGAERVCLVLKRDEGFVVEAMLEGSGEQRYQPLSVPLSQCEDVSPAMVRYVVRCSNNLVLGDATVQGEFTKDPYVLRRRPRSVLCCPILRNKTLVGALYLENNQAVEVFTPERVELLKLLAAQAAISIENASLFRDLQGALEQARESVRVKSEFLSKTTHELRTPLNAIINLPEMVKEKFSSLPVFCCTACGALFEREGAEDARDCPSCQGRGTLRAEEHCHYAGDLQEVPEIQQIVVDSGRALLQIVNNIIELSDHEGKKSELKLTEFTLSKLIGNVLKLIKPLADKKEIRLSVPEVSAEATIRADWSKLRQALYNLLDNAIKFSPRKSEVVFCCDSTAEGICFSIQDQGIGISAADQQLVFESFRQIDEGSTRKFGGMGLGLAVTKSLVELHGGSVWVESELGHGSTFHLMLPLQFPGKESLS